MDVPFVFIFGISGGELLILLLVVLLLFGPSKIPEIARMVGRGMGEVRKVQREINTEIHRYSSDIEREAKTMESEIKEITQENNQTDGAGQPVNKTKKHSIPDENDEDLPYPDLKNEEK